MRRISDGYIGRITEADGLISSKAKAVTCPPSYELLLSFIILSLSDDILSGLKKYFCKNGEHIFVYSVLNYIYGCYSSELFNRSFLYFRFSLLNILAGISDNQITGIERGTRMIADKLLLHFEQDLVTVKVYFSNVRLLEIHRLFYCCGITDTVSVLSEKYGIVWEDSLWQK